MSESASKLKISDVSRHAGVSVSTIRLWEDQELLKPSYTKTGRRVYSQKDVETARTIKRMRSLEGMKISEIKVALRARSVRQAINSGAEVSRTQVGIELRRLRKERALTIKELAAQIEAEPSVIASIERTSLGIDMPLLKRLADFHGLTLNKLMGVEQARTVGGQEVVSRGHGVLLPKLGLGVQMERLCSGRGALACKRWKIEPGVNSNGAYRHEGEEFLIVVSGQFEVTIDNQRVHLLTEGDSLYFMSDQLHAWRNPGREMTELVWIGVGDTF